MKKGIHFLFGSKEPVTDFYGIIDRFAALGFDCVEVPPDPFVEGGSGQARKLVRYAKEKQVEIVFSCGFSADCDMASGDGAVRKKGAAYLQKILQVMEEAEVGLLCGTCYTKWPSYRTEPVTVREKEEILCRTAELFGRTVKGITDSGIVIALEPLNRFEGFLINTAQEGVKFCELVDNPNVGLMLDGFHLSMEEDSAAGAVLTAGTYLKHLHLAENNRKLPGMGSFPWNAYFAALKKIGYKGRMDIEAFMTPGGSVSASVGLWRDLENGASREEQDELLKSAVSFIESKIREYRIGEV